MNYLPPDKVDSWDEYLRKKRSSYARFVEELLVAEGKDGGQGCDHPLNLEPDSKWQVFFKDNDVLLQIDKDVRWVVGGQGFFVFLIVSVVKFVFFL